MKLLLIAAFLFASTMGHPQSSEYLPPVEEYSGASSNAVETNFLENEPAHSLAEDGYRYRSVKRYRLRHRRDVSELSNNYLPPQSAEAYGNDGSEPAPAHAFTDDGYRYKTLKSYRLRRRY